MKLSVWTCIFTDNTILNFNPTLLLTHIKFTKAIAAHEQNSQMAMKNIK